jgi:Tol biopolymer transport system component
MNRLLLCILPAVIFLNSPAQNRDIISRLEIVNVKSLKRKVVKQFDYRVEAPNWTPDGRFLIYNSSGLLYKIPVKGGDPTVINTGTIKSCNNDHVISPDGRMIAISATGNTGKSLIFIIPFNGGEPELITPLGPSYLHGISPDNSHLSYCAERNGNYDVYVIPSEGGQEIRLTESPGLDDGPEYSPDGQTIWFNSVRTGLMQVWRMDPDGTDQKQVTFDEANNWFPHISPDGKLLSFITYRKGDVDPGSHPANKNVEIRMLNIVTTEQRTVVRLFGGQGTLNVNSWSPDSRDIAFVSYELPE